MAKLSMNEMTTYRWSFEEDVTHYRAAGFTAMGVWRQKLSDFGEEKGAALLAESGLKASNLLWAGGFTGSDGRTFRDSVEDAVEAVRLTAALRCDCLVVYTGARAGHTHNHARRLICEALKELAPLAAELKVQLAIEPMHAGCAGEWTFLTTLADTEALLDKVASPWVKLAFDTYHLGAAGIPLEEITALAKQIAVVHLGDGRSPPDHEQNRSRLGDGAIPLRDIVRTLAAAGYAGYYDIELIGEEIEADDYQALLRHSREAATALLAGT